MPGTTTHIRVTAIHEAGHALAALKVDRFVTKVAVSHLHPGNGVTFSRQPARNPFNLAIRPEFAWRHTLESTIDETFVLLAGPSAEAKYLNKPLRFLGSQSDYDRCLALFGRLVVLADFTVQQAGFDSEAPALNALQLMNQTRRRVRRWVGTPKVWRTIERVADQLALAGSLDAEDLQRIIGEAQTGTASLHLPFGDMPEAETTSRHALERDHVRAA